MKPDEKRELDELLEEPVERIRREKQERRARVLRMPGGDVVTSGRGKA
jgi:hypothetical protein